MPTVSIVIPVFNSEKYLVQCLDTVLNQTYKDIEIICVDDGSTDNSLSILNEYALKYKNIKVFQQNEVSDNAAKARNIGLKMAIGEYVLFLDSDDFFEASLVEDLVQKAEKTGAEMVICNADKYDQRIGKIVSEYTNIKLQLAPRKDIFNYKDCPDTIFQIGDWITWNKLYKRDLLMNNNIWFESIPISDDQYVVTIATVLAKSIAIVNKSLVHYRFNTGVSQVDTQSKRPEAAYKQFNSIVVRLKELGIYEDIKKSYVNLAFCLMRWFFDIMQDVSNMHKLYDEFKNNTFKLLGAEDLSSDYFFDFRIAQWYELLKNNSFEEILFKASRGYGAFMTTGILRFQCPYDKIEKNSKVILVGKGLVGRYWYSQLILSEYAEVVAWVDSEKDVSENIEYDQVIIAK